MNSFIKKNINVVISIFILLGPILDMLTGLCLHTFNINFTIGIIVRVIFLITICIITLFTFKKKNILIPYLIIGLYMIFYLIGNIIYKDSSITKEIQELVKVFYFPILFISLFSIKDEIRISKMTLFTAFFLYLIFIFVPTILGVGYDTYEITKAGTLGFFNSANEISGIISILTPIMFIILYKSNKLIPKLILIIMYLVVILMMGTKTPLLSLMITIGISLIYFSIKSFKEKKYKNIVASVCVVLIGIFGMILILPKTNFYKNIETHLHYLKLNSIVDVFKSEKTIDHFIFSSRLKFLHNKAMIYERANIYQKLFGIGYINNNKTTKMIEMDYFDIFYSHGIVGFLIFLIITIYSLFKILSKQKENSYERWMLQTSLILILFLAFFTGHILNSPSVSLIVIILILLLSKKSKRNLLFSDVNLELGGIEKAQVNLLDNIDYSKYNVTLVLEEKKGVLLKKVNKNVIVKEVKVSNNKNIIIRKLVNATRKLIFKILEYDNYDFSCCYTTYSYSCNKLALIASSNNSLYIHSDYKYVYKNKDDFRKFFDTRKVNEFKKIIFVSNESRNSFLEEYNELKNKCLVINNFIDTKDIISKSHEKIDFKKNKNKKLFVFVGRLDDSSKKLKRAINLVKEISSIELLIVGDGPDRKMYEEFTKKCKVENRVIFVGSKENPYPYMNEADYVILTSDYEGFPVTYLEAITLNKNIITTIETSDESIDMKDIAYIIPKKENEMVEKVKDILKKKNTNKSINIDKIQKNKIKIFEELFDN